MAFYEKPLLKFDRLLETYLAYAPAGLRSFKMALPLWLKQKLYLKREMNRGLQGRYKGRYVFTEHHESHAASAFFPSPFDEAAILTVDGVGEWATTTYGVGRGSKIELHKEIRFPHSLGLLYSAFTYYCGFKVNSGEHKLMGLAPYGEPKYVDRIAGKVIEIREDGSFRLDMKYFNYCQGLTMTNRAFEDLMGQPRRPSETELTQFYMDIAASIQAVTEDVILKLGRHIHRETGMKKICLAGGVALNCVANGRLLREGPFEDVWIQPAAGDAGALWGPPSSSGTSCSTSLATGNRIRVPATWDPRFLRRRSMLSSTPREPSIGWRTARNPSANRLPISSPTRRSSAGSRAAWSSGRALWAPAASWATRVPRRCRRR